jgi:hypothetical protein
MAVEGLSATQATISVVELISLLLSMAGIHDVLGKLLWLGYNNHKDYIWHLANLIKNGLALLHFS